MQTVLSQLVAVLAVLLFSASAFASGGAPKSWYTDVIPIFLLLIVVAFVMSRLPRVEGLPYLGNWKFRRRRAINWLSMGFTYAFLYWGRYNLQPVIQALGGENMVSDFNWIFGVGTAIYGASFLLNGPLTDRLGGRFSILMAAGGVAILNILMGFAVIRHKSGLLTADGLFWMLMILYPFNMYFQSFGAVAIVKANAAWFHVRERGVFGAIFGILISLGVYFAFDWSSRIIKVAPIHWAFFMPAIVLGVMFVVNLFAARNKPSDVSFEDIETGDASSGDTGPRLGAMAVLKLMLKSRVIMIIACIEFCSGFLRQAVMQNYRFFAKSMSFTDNFVYQNWGMTLCIAGILGGVFAGVISDRLYHSRRGPVAFALYAGMILGICGMFVFIGGPALGWAAAFVSLCVIGVHGMLSGTASMDFGGTRNVGVAVGIIDGFVYAGSGLQGLIYANILPKGAEAATVGGWFPWPTAMMPLAVIGLVLAFTIRNEKPKPKAAGGH